jgi:GPI mannosyltransferase 3
VKAVLAIIVITAIALRLWAASQPALFAPDETGQYLEQAHRLLFGYGAVPWEYRYGMRNWILPLLLTGPMAAGEAIAPGSLLYLILPKAVGAMASLSILWAAYDIGKRISQAHAFVAIAVVAVWFESIFFAGRPLSEPLSIAAILPAFALLLRAEAGQRQLIAAGFLIGAGILLRFQFGVAAGVFVLATCWQSPRVRLLPVVMGGVIAMVVGAVVDMAMGMTPFGWLATNIYQNIIINRSADYGLSGPWAYFGELDAWWGWGRFAILACLIPAYRANKILVWVAMVNIAVHMAIGHKEYRFILLSTTILMIVAAIGSVEIAKWLSVRFRWPMWSIIVLPIALWGGLSMHLALREPMVDRWTGFSGSLLAIRDAGKVAGACGVGIDAPLLWYEGAYTWLHRDVPIVMLERSEMTGAKAAFNLAIGPDTMLSSLGGDYAPIICRRAISELNSPLYSAPAMQVCLYQRKSGCDIRGHENRMVNAWLRARDQ